MRTFEPKKLTMALALLASLFGNAQQPFDLDPSFRAEFDDWYISSILPVEDGKLLISGWAVFPDVNDPQILARLNNDGTRDITFPEDQVGQGKLTRWNDRVYVGRAQVVSRILMDGQLDPDWAEMNTTPYFLSLQGGDYHVYPDGRILMSGAHQVNYPDSNWVGIYNLIWFTSEGYLDTTRAPRISDGVVYEIEELPDGRFMCTGPLSTYEGQATGTIFRVQADGTFDPSFQSGLAFGEANTFTPLADGLVLASGLFMSSMGATDTTQFIRYMVDGTLDPTFNNDLVVSSAEFGRFLVLWHTRLPDGRILLHGNFDHVEGQWRGGIALLDQNGELLNTAFTGQGCGYYEYMGYPYHGSQGAVFVGDSMIYIHGAYHGYDDGTTDDPDQRFVTRLYGPDFGTGIEMGSRAMAMQLYPNPTSGSIALQLEQVPRGATVIVRDALGREVLRRRISDHYTTLAIERSGVYMLDLHGANGRIASERVVVE